MDMKIFYLKTHLAVLMAILVLAACATPGRAEIKDEAGPNPHSTWTTKFGAEERFRHEYRHDFDFNQSAKDNGTLFFHRLKLNFEATLLSQDDHKLLDVFIEGLDAQTGSYQTKATAGQVDDFDFHQGYIGLYDIIGTPIDLKFGRQKLEYGKGRLMGAPSWNNRIRSYDAALVRYNQNGFSVDLLFGQDVKYDDNTFNRSSDEENISGIYAAYQKEKESPIIEGYFLNQVVTSTDSRIQRFTVGPHFQAVLPGKIAVDFEMPYQFGETGTKDIRAYALHFDVAREFPDLILKPKFYLSYDQASGDKDPNDDESNTFNPLYQSTHTPYGQMDFFRWQNIRNPEVGVQFSATKKLKITPQADFFWLESKSDSWYNSSGTAVRTKTSGDRNYFVGSELSLRANYDWTKNIKLEGGYAHFFTGGFVKDTGADDDADWVYSQLNIKY